MTILKNLFVLCFLCAMAIVFSQRSDAREIAIPSAPSIEKQVNSALAKVHEMINPDPRTKNIRIARDHKGRGASSTGRRKIQSSDKGKVLKKKKPVIGKRVRSNRSNYQSFMPRSRLPGSLRIYGPNR